MAYVSVFFEATGGYNSPRLTLLVIQSDLCSDAIAV